jgi:hypothetical protein
MLTICYDSYLLRWIDPLAYFHYFEKIKVGLWDHHPACVCVFVYPPPHQILEGSTNRYLTWYVYHGTYAHLDGVFHKSLPSICVTCMCVLRLGNCSVKTSYRLKTLLLVLLINTCNCRFTRLFDIITIFLTHLLYITCRICSKYICSISTGSWMNYVQWHNSYTFLFT